MNFNISGWIKQPTDARDLLFAAPLTAVETPNSINLSIPRLGPPFEPAWDQSSIGSCGPHTALISAVYALMAAGEIVEMPSRLFTYYATRMIMGTVNQDSGVDNRSLMKSLNKFGLCPESMWPYDVSRFRQKPPQACFDAAAKNIVHEYRAVPQSLEQMCACLAGSPDYQGRPIVFGFSVFESLMSDATARTGKVPMPRNGEQPIGGHDVALVGFDKQRAVFILRNSWGDWGDDGYGEIPFEYALNPQLANDFWTPYRVRPLTV